MKNSSRFAVLFSSTALAGLIYVQMHGSANATTSPSTVQAAVAQAVSPTVNSPPLVNLPDFSRLVDRAGPAVVSSASSRSAPTACSSLTTIRSRIPRRPRSSSAR